MSETGRKSVDAYLAKVPPEMRESLERLRRTIRAAAPDAEEVISYQMPAFRHRGNLVYYAAFRDHGSLFIGSIVTQRKFAAELKSFAAGKGTVHFTPEQPLPAALVTRIVKARVAENEARARLKEQTSSRTKKKPR
jgi:uncharacterized protein YdhG (YjbR/CyaY superfamily)